MLLTSIHLPAMTTIPSCPHTHPHLLLQLSLPSSLLLALLVTSHSLPLLPFYLIPSKISLSYSHSLTPTTFLFSSIHHLLVLFSLSALLLLPLRFPSSVSAHCLNTNAFRAFVLFNFKLTPCTFFSTIFIPDLTA